MTESAQLGVRALLDAAPMSPAQVRAVALTVALSALDGYDVLSVTFTAPAISHAWSIGRVELGAVLSSGLVGMAAGSFVLAPAADLVGRRTMALVSLILMGVGSLLSATAGDVLQLSLWRVCTGLGIGACVAIITPLAAEFSNASWRSFSLASMAMGYPAGGLVGGLLAAALLRWSGWPAVFVAGAVAAVAMMVAVATLLPESPAFLAGRPNGQGLERLNALLTRFGQPTLANAPALLVERRGYAGVFAADRFRSTIRLAAVNALVAAVIYYVLSWLPQLVSDSGFTPSQGSLISATLSLVGIVGGLSLGALVRRGNAARITAAAIMCLGAAVSAFGTLPPSMPALVAGAAVLGFLIFASSAGFYGVLATAFGDAARASGSGFVIGVGRVASAAAPLAAGWFFAAGLDRSTVSAAFGGCALLAGLLLVTHRDPEGLKR